MASNLMFAADVTNLKRKTGGDLASSCQKIVSKYIVVDAPSTDFI